MSYIVKVESLEPYMYVTGANPQWTVYIGIRTALTQRHFLSHFNTYTHVK